ncbi:hypothetical protein ACSW8S_19245 (plasmid) [Clostridium perfringens]
MRFKEGAIADVLWLIFLTVIFIVVMNMQMSFSSTATIDAYAKNIVNEEATRFVTNINGYSTKSENVNMYNSKGKKREFGSENDRPAKGLFEDEASANSIVNFAKKDMKESIIRAFANNSTLKSRTKSSVSNSRGITEEDISVEFTEKSKSTLVKIEVAYKVVAGSYTEKKGGFVDKTSLEIPRKVVITRSIENPLRFKILG